MTDRSAAASVRSKDIPNFGDASAKLVPEVGFNKGKVISVNKNPGGEPTGARTADLGTAKQPINPADWDSLKGQQGGAAFDTAHDMKLGEGKGAEEVPVPDGGRRTRRDGTQARHSCEKAASWENFRGPISLLGSVTVELFMSKKFIDKEDYRGLARQYTPPAVEDMWNALDVMRLSQNNLQPKKKGKKIIGRKPGVLLLL